MSIANSKQVSSYNFALYTQGFHLSITRVGGSVKNG